MNASPDIPIDPVTGGAGELIDRFLSLVGRETATDPQWWFNYGSLALLRFNAGFFTQETGREAAMDALKEVLERAVLRGNVAEDFLVRSLRQDLDEFVKGRDDPAKYDGHAADMKRNLESVIEDPVARARWRRSLEEVNSSYVTLSDDEMVAEARRLLDEGRITAPLSATDVAGRWAQGAEWRALSTELLSDEVIERWAWLAWRKDSRHS